MKTWYLQNSPSDVAHRIRELLDPEAILHEAAKDGAMFLLGLPDDQLSSVFYALIDKRKPPSALASELAGDDDKLKDALTAALRRLSLVGIPLASELRKQADSVPPEKPVIGLRVAPGVTMQDHLDYASKADKALDGVGKMASLTSLLEQQLVSLYAHPTRNANPFMMLAQVNQSASLLMTALEKLHKMQIEGGIIKRQPDMLEVDLKAAGAFQTYIGELDNGAKDQMNSFATAFHRFVKDRKSNTGNEG